MGDCQKGELLADANERGLGDSNRLFDSAITQTFIYRFSRRRVAGVDLRLDMRNMREKEDTI